VPAVASRGAVTPVTDAGRSGRATSAPASSAGTYTLQFTCAQPDYRTQIRGVHLYRKDRQLFFLPDFEKMTGQLLARSKESIVLMSFPTQGLSPGRYTATLCGDRTSLSWAFTVKPPAPPLPP
jgi:hypothetical protein